MKNTKKISKFISFALRHNPDKAGVSLDKNGWCNLGDLSESISKEFNCNFTKYDIREIVKQDSKERYQIKNNKIRARYGHSDGLDVEINSKSINPPTILYHGTPTENVESIMNNGLKSSSRKKVHLTSSKKEAKKVGKRHDEDIALLKIETDKLNERENNNFYKRGKKTFLTSNIPPEYIHVVL